MMVNQATAALTTGKFVYFDYHYNNNNNNNNNKIKFVDFFPFFFFFFFLQGLEDCWAIDTPLSLLMMLSPVRIMT